MDRTTVVPISPITVLYSDIPANHAVDSGNSTIAFSMLEASPLRRQAVRGCVGGGHKGLEQGDGRVPFPLALLSSPVSPLG